MSRLAIAEPAMKTTRLATGRGWTAGTTTQTPQSNDDTRGCPRTDSGGALGGLRRVKAAQGLPPSPDVDEACAGPSPLTTAQAWVTRPADHRAAAAMTGRNGRLAGEPRHRSAQGSGTGGRTGTAPRSRRELR